MTADDGQPSAYVQVELPFDLEPGDIRRFLSYQVDGRRFVFQRRQAGHALTYVWLDGDVLQTHDTSTDAWRAELERRLAAVVLDSSVANTPFPGGAIGFFSYEALCAARFGNEGLPGEAPSHPAVMVAFTRVFAVLDQRAGRGSLIALAAKNADRAGVCAHLAERLASIRAAAAPSKPLTEDEDWILDISEADYIARVSETQRLIADGAIEQMILSIGIGKRAVLDPVTAFEALVHDNPSPHEFLIGAGAFNLLGASPLLHLSITDRLVTIETDAGTRPAGLTEAESQRYANELLTSLKDEIEQKIITQATLLDLAAITVDDSIAVVADREVRRFSHTMHLYTVMRGELHPALSTLEAMLACAPAAALVGAPKREATEAIERIEHAHRGPYGGLVALLGYDGSLDSAVVLRSLWSDGSFVHLRSGGGITMRSNAEEEYSEALQKARTVVQTTTGGAFA